MTKFLKQSCQLERAFRKSDGSTVLDKYGEVQYTAPTSVQCRRERVVKDVQTNTGSIMRSSTRYFLDERHAVQVDDKLDGCVILEIEEYVNQFGLTEGFECYV